jgi:drug/metabolite transporter (DMT)-like permease
MNSTPDRSAAHLRGELALVLVAFLWGFTFVAVKAGLRDASTYVFLSIRFTIGAALMGVIFWLRPGSLTGFWRAWRGGLICGSLLFLGYVTQTVGLLTTSASKSAFLTGLYIVIVPVLSSAIHRRSPRVTEWLGALAATVGTALLTLNPAVGLHLSSGDLLTIACAVCYSFYLLAVARFSSPQSHHALALWQVVMVAVLSLLFLPWAEPARLSWTPRFVAALIGTAVFATTICFLLYTWAQSHTTALRAALVLALEPVFAAVTGWLWAGDRWTALTFAGAALILGAIVLVDLSSSSSPASTEERVTG